MQIFIFYEGRSVKATWKSPRFAFGMAPNRKALQVDKYHLATRMSLTAANAWSVTPTKPEAQGVFKGGLR